MKERTYSDESELIDYDAIRQTAREAVAREEIDYEAVRQVANEIVPLQSTLGLTITRLDGAGAVSHLPLTPAHLNHVGTAHAAVLFLVAEAAAGSALVGCLGAALGRVTFVAKEATIRYAKPASSDLRGLSDVGPEVRALLDVLETDRRASVELEAQVVAANEVVAATASFRYHLRLQAPQP